MVFRVNDAYGRASKSEKTKILDGFVAATGYDGCGWKSTHANISYR
jgi:hypothetical protein